MTMLIRTDSPMRQAIPAMLQTEAPIIVLTAAALSALMEEADSPEKAAQWMARMASRYEKPIAVHVNGMTRFIAPSHWTQERLRGYIAAHHELLEAEFGEISHFIQGNSQ